MNRRRAIQVFAAASFGSAVVHSSVFDRSLMAAEALEPTSSETLLRLLRSVSTAAEACDRSSFRLVSTSSSLRNAIRDAGFFSWEAARRLQFSHEKSPAFWQTCMDRLRNAATTLETAGSQQVCRMDLADALGDCLPELASMLNKSLT
jgi:hypothetical protein